MNLGIWPFDAIMGNGGGSGYVSPTDWTNVIPVLFVMGQSNSDGSAEASRMGLVKYPLMDSNVYLFRKPTFNTTNNGTISPLKSGVNTTFQPSPSGTTFGAYAITTQLLSSYLGGQPVYVLLAARGGSSLQVGLSANPCWDPTIPNEMFDYATQGIFTPGIAAIQSANPGKTIKVFISWQQGEADNTDDTATANYPVNFAAFMVAIKAYNSLLNAAPWLITKLYYNLTANETALNNYFQSLASSNIKILDASSQPQKQNLSTDQKGGFSPTTTGGDDKHDSYLFQALKGELEYSAILAMNNPIGNNTEYTTNTQFDPSTISSGAGNIRLQLSRDKVTINSITNVVTSPINDLHSTTFVTTGNFRFKVDQRRGRLHKSPYDNTVDPFCHIESSALISTSLFNHSFSVGGWFKPYSGISAATQTLVYDIDNVAVGANRFSLFITALGEIQFQYNAGAGVTCAAKTPVIFNDLITRDVHIALTATSGGLIRIYVNGVLQVLTTVSGAGENISALTMANYVNATNNIRFFVRRAAVNDLPYTGEARELMIQPVVWSAGDIANIMLN